MEQQLKPDQYKSIDVRQITAGNFIKVKLHKGNKVFERVIEGKPGQYETFKTYSAGVLHNGNECYLKLTGALAKSWKNFNLGDNIQVFAIPSNLKGGKSYVATSMESQPTAEVTVTDKDNEVFASMMKAMIENGLTLNTVDDAVIRDTLFADHQYSPQDADRLVPAFKEYYKKHN